MGGDFYHAIGYEDGVRWMIGDVSGTPCADSFRLSVGDCLWFLTDGVIEARAPDGTRGLDLEALAFGVGGQGVGAVSALLHRIREAAGRDLGDDSAALIIEYRPGR